MIEKNDDAIIFTNVQASILAKPSFFPTQPQHSHLPGAILNDRNNAISSFDDLATMKSVVNRK